MAVRMGKVLARPWFGVRVCHLLLLLFLGTRLINEYDFKLQSDSGVLIALLVTLLA